MRVYEYGDGYTDVDMDMDGDRSGVIEWITGRGMEYVRYAMS